VSSAALHCDQLDALCLVVVEGDRGPIQSVRGSHFDAVKELHHSACSPSELVSGGCAGSRSRAFHHKVVWGVRHGLGGHGARRRAVDRGHAGIVARDLGQRTSSIGTRSWDDVDDWRHGVRLSRLPRLSRRRGRSRAGGKLL